ELFSLTVERSAPAKRCLPTARIADGEGSIRAQWGKACRECGRDQTQFLSGRGQRGAHYSACGEQDDLRGGAHLCSLGAHRSRCNGKRHPSSSLTQWPIPQWLVTATGSVLVLFSAFCFGAAVWRHIYPGAPPPQPDVPRIPPWLLIALNSFLALVALAALMGIWFERGGPS